MCNKKTTRLTTLKSCGKLKMVVLLKISNEWGYGMHSAYWLMGFMAWLRLISPTSRGGESGMIAGL